MTGPRSASNSDEAPRLEVANSPLALRPKDAATALGISERKLWSLTNDPTSGIPHVRLGGVVLYPVRELQDWLARRAREQMAAG